IPVEYSQHEDSPSQHEIDLRHTDALTMADTVMTTRLIVKEIAQDAGVYATFMPKPIAGQQGSGMHTHFSLFEGDVNAFHYPGDEHGLSTVAKGCIAGLLRHAPEITAITNQWVNSYKLPVTGHVNEAIASMGRADVAREVVGEHVCEWFIRNKRAEWGEYKTQVSQFELDRYLPRL